MGKRNIYEYPGELLWHKRELQWYLDNDPEWLNHSLADALYEIKKCGCIIRNFEDIITDAYRVAVAVASTDNPKYTDIHDFLFRTYRDEISLLCGCVILLSQEDIEDYEVTINEILGLLRKKNKKNGLFNNSKLNYKWLECRIIKSQRSNMDIDLSPDAGDLSIDTEKWLVKNLKDIDELESVIRLYRTKGGQLNFLNNVVSQCINYDTLNMPFYLSGMNLTMKFTISQATFEELENEVRQGRYIEDKTEEMPEWCLLGGDFQRGPDIFYCENHKGQSKNENNIIDNQNKTLGQENNKLRQENNKLKQANKTLKDENMRLKEKIAEWEALYASGFAGSAVVEGDEGAKVVNSDAALKNEEYKKEIGKKEARINELSNKLKNESIPMSSIVDGFKELALLGKEDVSSAYKSLCTMLQDNSAWRNNRESIKVIFVEGNTPAPGIITHYYASGANHYDHHRELTIKDDDKKNLRKEKKNTES